MATVTRSTVLAQAAERFRTDTTDHVLEIAHNDGLYRHLRARKPGASSYWFDLITWPGNLTITGDMGCFTFARDLDMFDFFGPARPGRGINPGYWAEKIQGTAAATEYSEDLLRELVTDHIASYDEEWPGLATAVGEQILEDPDGVLYHEAEARALLDAFTFTQGQDESRQTFRFADTWEWSFREHSVHYLWCCHAIQWAIAEYRKAGA